MHGTETEQEPPTALGMRECDCHALIMEREHIAQLRSQASLYVRAQHLLKPVFVDIPLLVRHWMGYQALPAYLLQINYICGTIYCKALVHNMPPPLFIGTQIIAYKKPSFIYLTVPLAHTSLLYNFAPFEEFFVCDISEYWATKTLEEVQMLIPSVQKETLDIARELLSIADASCGRGVVDLYPDTQLDEMEPYVPRSVPKSGNTQQFKFEKLNQKLSEDMIANRCFLANLDVALPYDEVHWFPDNAHQHIDCNLVMNELKFDFTCCERLTAFCDDLTQQYRNLINIIVSSAQLDIFMESLLDKADALVTELIAAEQNAHLRLTQAAIKPSVEFNFELVYNTLRSIRKSLAGVEQIAGNAQLPVLLEQLLIYKMQLEPLMIILHASCAYFDSILASGREVAEFLTFERVFLLSSQRVEYEELSSVIADISEFLQPISIVECEYFGGIATKELPDILARFLVELQLTLEIRVSSLIFEKIDNMADAIARNEWHIKILLFCLSSSQRFVLLDFDVSNFTPGKECLIVEPKCFIDSFFAPETVLFAENETLHSYIVFRTLELFDYEFDAQKRTFEQHMQQADELIKARISELFELEDFVVSFSNWKQYNTQFLQHQRFSVPAFPESNVYISSEEQLKRFHVCNLDESNFVLDFSKIAAIVQQFSEYNSLVDEISSLNVCCYFLHFDLSFVTQTLRRHFDSCVFSVLSEIQEVLFNAYGNIAAEYRQVRDIVELSVCSPEFHAILTPLTVFFSDTELKKQLGIMYNGICTNIHNFYCAFEPFYRPGYINNLITPEELDIFNKPIYELARLAGARSREQNSCSEQSGIEMCLLQTFEWLKKTAELAYEYVAALMDLDHIKQQEMLSNPVKFFEQNRLLSTTLVLPPLTLTHVDQELELDFLSSLAKVTRLHFRFSNTEDDATESEIYELLNNKYAIVPGDGIRTLESYTEYDYENVVIGVHPPPIELRKLFTEAKFVVGELVSIQKWLESWLGTFADKGEKVRRLIEQNAFPSLFSLNSAIAPLYEIINGIEYLQRRHLEVLGSALEQYPATLLLETLERVSIAIEIIRDRTLRGPFAIYSCLYDFAVKEQTDRAELDKLVVRNLDYSNYQDYLIFAEDYVLKFVPSINFMFLLQSRHFCSAVNHRINTLLGIGEEDLRNVEARQLLARFEVDNEIFDLLLTIWYNEKINFDVTKMLRKCVASVKNIIIEAAFCHPIDSSSPEEMVCCSEFSGRFDAVDFWENLNQITLVVLLPHYAADIISQCLHQVALVTNNAGYVNYGYEIANEDIFEKRMLHHYFQEAENEHSKWRYSKRTEQLARNVESLCLLVETVMSMLERIPDLLYDLQLILRNGVLFAVDNQYRKAEYSYLTVAEKVAIVNAMHEWNQMCALHFPKGVEVSVAELAIENCFVDEISKLLQSLEALYEEIQRHIGTDHRISPTTVPVSNGVLFPLSLLLPGSFRFRFLSINEIHSVMALPFMRKELLVQFSNVTINKMNQLISIQSNEEVLQMKQPVSLPRQMYFAFDIILQQSGDELSKNCMSAYDMLFVAVERYIKLRRGQETIYLADLTENSQYASLPAYFKQFESVFNQFRFQEVKVAISTMIAMYYQYLFKLAITGQIEKDDFKEVFFIINDLSVAAFLYKQKSDVWRESIVVRLHEWQSIFQEAISIFLSKDNCQIETESPEFAYEFYDEHTSSIIVTDSRNSFFLNVGQHWLGSANVFDANLKLTTAELAIFAKILKAIAQKQTVIMLGAHGKHYENSEHNILLIHLSRMLFRRYIFVVVTEFTFQTNLKRICACLIAGYIVQLIGVEYLEEKELLQLVSLSDDLRNGNGAFPLFRYVKDIASNAEEGDGVEYANILIENCANIGILLYYLPEEFEIESSYDFEFTKAKELSEKEIKLHYSFASKEETSQLKNVVEQYETYYEPSQKAKTLATCFSGALMISVEESSPVEQFMKVTEQHGRAFYDIQTFLQTLNSSFICINQYDIPQIYSRARDKSDNFSVAVVTLDYVLRELIKFEEGENERLQVVELIASVVACAFALDKNNSAELMEQAKFFAFYIENSLRELTAEKSEHNESPRNVKYNFTKYFQDYLQRNCNQELANSLQLYSTAYELPLECIFDILAASEYLKSKNPLLLVSINHAYLNIFLAVFAAIKKAALKIVSTSLQLIEQLERPFDKKCIIVVQPGCIIDLENMLDQLVGMFLAYPVVQTQYGYGVYWADDKNAPIFLLVLTADLYAQLLKLPVTDLFSHRMLLIPNIEGSMGSKINLTSNFTTQINAAEMHAPEIEQIEREQLKFVTTSRTAENLIFQYEAEMITSAKKQEQEEEISRKRLVLPNYVKTCFFVLFDILQEVFGIGKSEEEVLLLRSLIDYFLLRFKCIRVKNSRMENRFVDFAAEELESIMFSDVKRKQMLYESVKNSENQFERFTAIQYISSKAGLLDPKQQRELKAAMQELNCNLFMLDEHLKLETFNPDAEINGFSREFLKGIEVKLMELTQGGNVKMQTAVQQVIFDSMNATEADLFGYGFEGSLAYELAEEFVQEAFFHDKSALNSLTNILVPLAISFWNAGSVYYATVAIPSRQQWYTSKRGMVRNLEEKYALFTKSLAEWELPNENCFVGIGAAILLNIQEQCANFNEDCIREFNRFEHNSETLHRLQHKLQPDDIRASYSRVFQVASRALPEFSHEPFSYINYTCRIVENKESKLYQKFVCDIKFVPFQLGKGVLSNVFKGYTHQAIEDFVKTLSEDSLSYLLSELEEERKQSQIQQEQNTKEEEIVMYQKLSNNDAGVAEVQSTKTRSIIENKNPYDSDDENDANDGEIERFRKSEERMDVEEQEIQIGENPNAEQLISKFVDPKRVSCSVVADEPIYLDTHRIALCVVIAACMLSPLTVSVTGPRRSGKSVLIDVAKLLVRDLCSQSLFFIEDSAAPGDAVALRGALTRKYLAERRSVLSFCDSALEDKPNEMPEWTDENDRVLKYYVTMAYPSCHIHASDSNAENVAASLTELLENHYLQFATAEESSGSVAVMNAFERENGLLMLSDTSFIIECDHASPLSGLAAIKLEMPPISESFSVEYAKVIFPNSSDLWIREFVRGVFLVQNSLNAVTQTSFDFFTELLHNELLTASQSTFASPLMVEKISMYETKGVEIEDMISVSPVSNLLREQNDQELATPNIHSFFAALRNMSISQLSLEEIEEKLVSLCLLGNLQLNAFVSKSKEEVSQKNFVETPWSDSQLLLEQNFVLHPIWEAYIVNEALQNARRSVAPEQIRLQDQFTLSVQRLQQIIIPKHASSVIFALPQLQLKEIAFLSQNYQYNSYLYYHFMEIYRIRGSEHNPIVFNKLIELYYCQTLQQTKNRLISRAKMHFGVSNLNEHQLTGISGENDLVTTFDYIFEQVNKFASVVENEFGKNDEVLEFLLQEKKKLQNIDVHECVAAASQPLRGFPLTTLLELRPVKHCIFLEHCTAQFYLDFIKELRDISGSSIVSLGRITENTSKAKASHEKAEKMKYKIYELDDVQQLLQESLFKSVSEASDLEHDVLIEVQSIYQAVVLGVDENKTWNGLDIEMYNCVADVYHKFASFSPDRLRIIIIIAILRFSVLAALGIDPNAFAFCGENPRSTVGIPVRSQFMTVYPSKTIEQGRLVNMLPSAVCNRAQIKEILDSTTTRERAHLNSLTTQSMINLQKSLEKSTVEEPKIDEHIGKSRSITLVIPWSLANIKTDNGASIYELLSRLVEPLNDMPTIFDHEELLIICYLIAKKHKIVSAISPNQLSIMLNQNYKLLIVGEEPVYYSKTPLSKVLDLGVVQLPVNGLIGNYKARYEELVQMQQIQQQSRQRQSDSLVKEFAGGHMNEQSQFQVYLKEKEQASKNNVIASSIRDLLPLMKMSDCEVPKDNKLFQYLQIDEYFFKQEYSLALLAVYQEMQTFCVSPSVSLCRFSQFAAEMCDAVIEQLELFFNEYVLVASLFKFYQILADPLKTPLKQVDLSQFSASYIFNTVNSELSNQINGLKQKGLSMPTEKEINLQTAAGECVYVRNFFSTVLHILESEFPRKLFIARNSHLDAISAAASIFFGLSGKIDTETLRDKMLSGCFGELGPDLVSDLKSQSRAGDLLNIAIQCIIRDMGIECEMRSPKGSKVKYQTEIEFAENGQIISHIDEDFFYLGSQIQGSGQFVFPLEMVETLTHDWPVEMILRHFEVEQDPGDTGFSTISTALLTYENGYKTFFVENDIAVALAVCIAALHAKSADSRIMYYEDNRKNAKYKPGDPESPAAKIVDECKQRLATLDCGSSDFDTLVSNACNALEDPNSVIIFLNCGASNATEENMRLLGNLLYASTVNSVAKSQNTTFYGRRLTLARDMHDIPIIIGFTAESATIDQFLYRNNLCSQVAIDKMVFFIPTARLQSELNQQKSALAQETRLEFIEQRLIGAVLGTDYCAAMLTERVRVCEMAANVCVDRVQRLLESFIKKVVLSQLLSENEAQLMKIDEHTFEKISQLTSTGDMMNTTLLETSFLVSENAAIKSFYDELINSYKEISQNIDQRSALESREEVKADVVSETELYHLEMYIINKNAAQLISEVSRAIALSIDLFREVQKYHFPVEIMAERDNLNHIFTAISRDIPAYVSELAQRYADVQRENSNKIKAPKFLVDEHVLLYDIRHNSNGFKKYLVSLILPLLSAQLYKLFPRNYANALWLLNSLLFLAQCGIICESPAELESVARVFCYTQTDSIRLATSYHLSQIFNQASSFSVAKLYTDAQLESISRIVNINQIIPEICNISSQLQYAWMMFNVIARYSRQMHESMPWFVTNHASLVTFCQSNNALLSLICYYLSKDHKIFEELSQDASREVLEEVRWFNELIALYEKQKNQIIDVPPNFRAPSAQVFYLAFCISIALNPETTFENIEILSYSMRSIFRHSPDQLQEETTTGHNIISQEEIAPLSSEECAQFIAEPLDNLFNICGVYENGDLIGIAKICISRGLTELFNLIRLAFNSAPGELSINIIYYDANYSVAEMLRFAFQSVSSAHLMKAELHEVQSFNLEIAEKHACVIFAQPSMNGHTVVEQIVNCVKTAKQNLEQIIYYPLFVLIPSMHYAGGLNGYSEYGATRHSDSNTRFFMLALEQLQRICHPNYLYLKQSETLEEAFQHYLCTAAQTLHLLAPKKQGNSRRCSNIITLRGLSLLILKLSLLAIRQEATEHDGVLIAILHTIIIKTLKADSLPVDAMKTPFLARALADLQAFECNRDEAVDRSIHRIHKIYDEAIHEALFFAPDEFAQEQNDTDPEEDALQQPNPLSSILPSSLLEVLPRPRGIDERIKQEMNVQLESENESVVLSQENSESAAVSVVSSRHSQVSEISDDEGDFDDSMSMFSQRSSTTQRSQVSELSQVSGVSAASSINSAAFNKFGREEQVERVDEENYYWNLVSAIALETGAAFIDTDFDRIEKSISEIMSVRERRIRRVGVRMVSGMEQFAPPPRSAQKSSTADQANETQTDMSEYSVDQEVHEIAALFIEPNFGSFESVQRLLRQLRLYTEFNSLHAQSQKECLRWSAQFHTPNPLQAFRRVFSLPCVQRLYCGESSEQAYADFEKMPEELAVFLRNAASFGDIQTRVPSLFATPEALQRDLAQISINQGANILSGMRGFAQFTRNWVISAPVFGVVLGDIFEYIKIYNSVETNSSLARQRIIVSDQIPYKHIKILEDGYIDFGSPKDVTASGDKTENASKQPFYVTLRGFELNNIGYDLEQRTVCDFNDSVEKGFVETFDLYACVCVIDSWQTGFYDEKLENTEHLHVCGKYVPVPLMIGGYCRPIVLLGNKTDVPGNDWLKRGPFFGVKEM